MDHLLSFISALSESGPLWFVIVTVVAFGGLYLYDSYFNNCCSNFSYDNNLTVFGYEDYNEILWKNNLCKFVGPAVWPQMYAAAAGCKQSPLNLKDRCSIVVPSETVPPLVFSCEFDTPPKEMKLYNSGYNEYMFHNIRFRWGPNDNEGSEHMVNCTRYAMELQATFVKNSYQHDDILQAAKCGSLLILSYVFMVTPRDNPYLEPIVNALQYIKNPMACISIEPIILSLLTPAFSKDYFTYSGSLTFPPCTEGVTWIVKPEPLVISSRQVRKFRKLKGCTGLITNNSRPVQKMNNRDVFYYDCDE
ncbi:hypothetical protein NQ314_002307 [Rhamnusium bicolor]|uniref:Alpha-carbonic anhydrase domain-containing protein n=1 Tax=Rhamnusium bicolor TaxID=1586634 RepID=A0AAV8ZS02_9CUCU|nr:hypothetical protein NQ314_002307 [Rhamnusium bicolor]